MVIANKDDFNPTIIDMYPKTTILWLKAIYRVEHRKSCLGMSNNDCNGQGLIMSVHINHYHTLATHTYPDTNACIHALGHERTVLIHLKYTYISISTCMYTYTYTYTLEPA